MVFDTYELPIPLNCKSAAKIRRNLIKCRVEIKKVN